MPLSAGAVWRSLMSRVLIAGLAAGLVTFAVQALVIGPLIVEAEAIEAAASSHDEHGEETEWSPADGIERTAYTFAGTLIAAIGFGAVLLGAASLLGLELTVGRGVMLGVAGFLCFALAPALGLPPKPPGVPGADVAQAQFWWAATAVATGVGLWLLFRRNGAIATRVVGLVAIAVPHLIGAPVAPATTAVPVAFAQQFAVASVASQLVLWIVLGTVGGWLEGRRASAPHQVLASNGIT